MTLVCVPGTATAEIVAGPSLLDSKSVAVASGAALAAAAVAIAYAAGAAATATDLIQLLYLSLVRLQCCTRRGCLCCCCCCRRCLGPPPLLLLLLLSLLLLLLLQPMLSLPCRCCCNRCRYHSNAHLLRNRSQIYLDHHTLDAAGNDEERGTLAPTRNRRPSLSFGSSKYQAGPSTALASATDSDCFTSCTTGLAAWPAAKCKKARG